MKNTGRIAAVLAAGTMVTGCTTMMAGNDEEQVMAVPVCPTETRNWTAFVNAMPGPGARPTLIVQGEALLPERASVTLTKGPTNRMQPPGQIMRLSVEPSEEAAGWHPVRGEVEPGLPSYAYVDVVCGDAVIQRIEDITVAQ
ncbi:hypothetical protein [uncultured Croceicoccus sp.]|uniref:hypothetical protein n=1 Tax=uncultured Croceicoccus sp. TaxID=1295329 RepID=UPI00261A5B2E|nr:hypothetical protein [uncultured Croceicoccus sp.]